MPLGAILPVESSCPRGESFGPLHRAPRGGSEYPEPVHNPRPLDDLATRGWWVLSGERNGFTGIGAGGQFLHIFPDQNVVVVQLGDARRLTNQKVCESLLLHRVIADHLTP